ncbi:hypothetical protein BKA70DRAFT_1259967 [Coprinopsis sp. MPI-PUGE-AT-0042]|nr:hypothetical protein BKA70DRAFT_1259967 [Coprinopsis sp. MPI-PUGE-AT-0042]
MDNILGQVSDVLPQIDLKEVEKGFSEFAHNIAKAEQALEKALAKGSFDLGHFSEAFVKEFEKRGLEFQQELLETTTLTEEDDVNFAELERSLDNILDKVQEVFVDVAGALQVDQIHSEKIFDEIRSPLKHLIVVTAKTIERHPCLLELALYLAVRPLPIAGWLISPIMTLLGFAAKGPVKGSFASSVQRKVYKDGVPKDSWFSKAQSAGMKGEGPPVLGTVLELSALGRNARDHGRLF